MKLTMVPIGKATQLTDVQKQIQAIENSLTAAAKGVQIDFNVTTRTFSKRPKFGIKAKPYERTVSTDDEIYGYVTRGTRPHKIRARNAPRLAFQAGYTRKSIPRVIASKPGGPSGPTVFALEVDHPGYEGTHDDGVIAKKWQAAWPRTLQRAILAAW